MDPFILGLIITVVIVWFAIKEHKAQEKKGHERGIARDFVRQQQEGGAISPEEAYDLLNQFTDNPQETRK